MVNNQTSAHSPVIGIAFVLGWLSATMLLWWFAFYQIPDEGADWLIRARAVCFGIDESGLPDVRGWLLLTLGPLSFLAAIGIAMKEEIRAGAALVNASTVGTTVAGAIVLLVVTQGFWVARQFQSGLAVAYADYGPVATSEALPDSYPRTATVAPWFSLTNQNGVAVSTDEMSGKAFVLTFAFAHCETVCPMLVTSAKRALRDLPHDTTELLIVTLDPWRDTPDSLPGLAKKWELPSNAHILSGSVAEVTDVIKRYQIPTQRNMTTGNVDHPALVYVIDPAGKLAYTFNNPSPQWLRQGVKNVLPEGSQIPGVLDSG